MDKTVEKVARKLAQYEIDAHDDQYPQGFTIDATLAGDGVNFFWHGYVHMAEELVAVVREGSGT